MARGIGRRLAICAFAPFLFLGPFAFDFSASATADEVGASAPSHSGFTLLTGYKALNARDGNTIVEVSDGTLIYRYDNFQSGMVVLAVQDSHEHARDGSYLFKASNISPVTVFAHALPLQLPPPESTPTGEADPRLRVEIDPKVDISRAKVGTPIGFVGNRILVKGNATWFPSGYSENLLVGREMVSALKSYVGLRPMSETLEANYGEMYVKVGRHDERRVYEGSTVVDLLAGQVTYVESSRTRQGRVIVVHNPYPQPNAWDELGGGGSIKGEANFRAAMKDFGIDCAQVPLCDQNAKENTSAIAYDWRDEGGTITCDLDPTANTLDFQPCMPVEVRIRKDYLTRPSGSLISPPWDYNLVFKGNIFGL